MTLLVDSLSALFLLVGAFFVLAGGIGIVRLPDFYSRMHAAGVTDTLGAGLILIGLTFEGGFTLVSVKLMMILVFLLVTTPTSCYALAHAARVQGLEPLDLVRHPNSTHESTTR